MRWTLPLLVVVLVVALPARAAEEPIAIPFVTDPTPIVDGSLQEWQNRGLLREITRPEQATFNRDRWKGAEDLSGWVRFGYDDRNLYVACHVVDDVFSQDQGGIQAWRGDHVMLNLDFIRSGKKGEIWRLGLAPGNLKPQGAAGPDLKPELVIWLRPGATVEGAAVAARRTPVGYDIEGAIPWAILQVTPAKYLTFGIEVGLSDCDSTPTVQEKVMSIGTDPWEVWDTNRLIPAVLADRTGAYPADVFLAPALLADEIILKHAESKELVVDVAEVPEGRIPTLTFKARAHHEKAAGCCGALLLTINGKSIAPENIANRPAQMPTVSGMTLSAWYGSGVRLWFGPDFDTIEKSQYKPLDVVSYDYILRLDNRFQKGRNVIGLKNTDERPEVTVVMSDLRFSWSPPTRFTAAKEWKPAPTGELPLMAPLKEHTVAFQASGLPGGAVKVAWAGREQVFSSQFSAPDGTWLALAPARDAAWQAAEVSYRAEPGEQVVFSGRAKDLLLVRTITPQAECVLVRDTIQNTSKDVERPLLISHATPPGAIETLCLGGRPIPVKRGAASQPANPSVVVLGKTSGFALLARDDIFRIHSLVSCDDQRAAISDNSLVVRPGVAYRHEWLIFPLDRPDYWRYVNAARRHFQTNFAIEGGFYFLGPDTPAWVMLKQLEWGGTRLVSLSPQSYYKGMFAHGPIMLTMDQSKIIATHKALGAVAPDVRRMNYFNCFNYNLARQKEDPNFLRECQALRPDGQQVSDGTSLTFYFPTLDNAYGKEMDKMADWLLNTVGAQGLYWDCYDYSSVSHYGEPWDGWTADIDPATHRIARKRSLLTILSWPWRERLTARLLKEGRPLVVNGSPSFTSEYQYRFPRFVETADITSCCQTHLFTPIALGDHITERTETDSYRWMLRALDWGALYYWYNILPTRTAFTAYMFPFTPIELHAGWVLGEERILTKESGIFGWGDASEFEVHVFDRVGKETDEIKVPRVVKDGAAWAELRLPEGYAAAIVRKGR